MRKNAHLEPQALRLLWETDPDAALLEWTYRMPVTPAAMEDAQPFIERLIKQWYGEEIFETVMDFVQGVQPVDFERRPITYDTIFLRLSGLTVRVQQARLLHLYLEGQMPLAALLRGVQTALLEPHSNKPD